MLVLSRLKEEAIMIGDAIEVRVLDVRGDRVRLGILAPPEVSVHRKEVFLAIQQENLAASRAESVDETLRVLKGEPERSVEPGRAGAVPDAGTGDDEPKS
jgi:carbon storage regulator